MEELAERWGEYIQEEALKDKLNLRFVLTWPILLTISLWEFFIEGASASFRFGIDALKGLVGTLWKFISSEDVSPTSRADGSISGLFEKLIFLYERNTREIVSYPSSLVGSFLGSLRSFLFSQRTDVLLEKNNDSDHGGTVGRKESASGEIKELFLDDSEKGKQVSLPSEAEEQFNGVSKNSPTTDIFSESIEVLKDSNGNAVQETGYTEEREDSGKMEKDFQQQQGKKSRNRRRRKSGGAGGNH